MRLLSTALPALAIALFGSAGARADECKKINTRITTSVSGCDLLFLSPVGMCTAGTVASGRLKGDTQFRIVTITPQSDSVFLYTGELKINTRSGTVFISDIGVLDLMKQTFSEMQNVSSGTDAFRGATGVLSSRGTAINGTFSGSLRGEICLADEDLSDHDDSVAVADDDHEDDDQE